MEILWKLVNNKNGDNNLFMKENIKTHCINLH